MLEVRTNAAAERIGGPESRPAATAGNTPPGRRLVDGPTAAAKAGCSYRHWLRLADSGRAPAGLKLGALRRWDLDQLDRWIEAGCKPVRTVRGTTA
jgi:predicted DNA-binding transcriptional regulator AlpA